MDKNRKKQGKKYIAWICMAALVIGLALMPMIAGSSSDDTPQASILSTTVERMELSTQIIGGGQLASEAALTLEIPEAVKLTGYLVGNGDIVAEGDVIASVDRVSVMTAITEVQETLDYLSEEIADISSDVASETVTARAGGTVKVIYAAVGDNVRDVMLEYGALALISLDGLMAVQVEQSTALSIGDTVCVELSDGTQVDGTVKSNLEGVLTVTVEDDDYSVGQSVTLTTEEGDDIGAGELYIYSQWSATAYTGTVSSILVSEGDTTYTGRTLMRLEDTGHTAQYQQLIDQRHEYEELMQELFQMYRTQTLTAPCDGIVTGVDEDGTFLLSDSGSGWFASLLASFTNSGTSGFVGYAARVTEVTADGLELEMNPELYRIEDLADLSGVSADTAAMTCQWHYTGGTTVYTQTEEGLLQADGSAEAGDLLLLLGDQETVCWLVRLDADAQQTAAVGSHVVMLSNTETTTTETTEETTVETTAETTETTTATDAEAESSTTESTTSSETTTVTYWGYVAQVVEVVRDEDGSVTMTVLQTPYAYVVKDLSNLPSVSTDTTAMTEEVSYYFSSTSAMAASITAEAGDILLLVFDESGAMVSCTSAVSGEDASAGGEQMGDMSQSDLSDISGSISTDSITGSIGTTQTQTVELYSLEKVTIASVTSQENMTVEISVDELDISKIYVGQAATITVDALGGEQFDAAVSGIANSGENSGGNSKFTVELTLEKSGDMLPGMSASVFIGLESYEDVLCVPVSALEEDGSQTILYTSYDEKNGTLGDPVTVTTGISDGENVQILEGMEEGMTCYYAYYDTLVISNTTASGGFSFSFNFGGGGGRR